MHFLFLHFEPASKLERVLLAFREPARVADEYLSQQAPGARTACLPRLQLPDGGADLYGTTLNTVDPDDWAPPPGTSITGSQKCTGMSITNNRQSRYFFISRVRQVYQHRPRRGENHGRREHKATRVHRRSAFPRRSNTCPELPTEYSFIVNDTRNAVGYITETRTTS